MRTLKVLTIMGLNMEMKILTKKKKKEKKLRE